MSVTRFLAGFFLGALGGAAAALLLTPMGGEELRDKINLEIDRVQAEVNQAAAERRTDLEHQLAALRQPRPPAA